jgi:Cu(I)/Ag(I) efflux system membrane fusion protein
MKPSYFALILRGLASLAAAGLAAIAAEPHALNADDGPRPKSMEDSSSASGAAQIREFTVPLERQQMIGVTYATAQIEPLRRTIRAAGVVATATDKHWDYVARVDGYVRTLGVTAPGDPVRKGQVLLDIYSPDLVATENETIDLLHMRESGQRNRNAAAVENAERLLAAARARLKQWNISDDQIDAFATAGAAEPYLPLNSPVAGIVKQVWAVQGGRVAVGDRLVEIVDLSSVWVWAEFYEDELRFLKPGLPVAITSPGLPNVSIPGKIGLVDPFLNDLKRTGRVRIDVDNPDLRLRPDAYVDVMLAVDDGEGLTVPFGAVLPTGEHNIVFVDKGSGRLEPRFVQLGGKFGDNWHVTGGLRAGERVVNSANFLIDAESKIQGALKDF